MAHIPTFVIEKTEKTWLARPGLGLLVQIASGPA
jgi:hypothetical protein